MEMQSRAGRALVLRLSGELGELEELPAAGLPPLVVLDLRGLAPLTAADARTVNEFARARAGEGIRCHVVADLTSPAAQTLTGTLPLFGDLERALTSEDEPVDATTLADQLESLTRTLLGETTV